MYGKQKKAIFGHGKWCSFVHHACVNTCVYASVRTFVLVAVQGSSLGRA